ncbi:Xanthine dehydrogenase, partial [Durusdinium trenchii]
MALEVISAPSNPLPCRPGEALVLRWQLRFSEDLAPGAQLQLRNGQAVAVIPDAVPARCCFELGLHVDAPSFEANAVQRFVFTAGEFSRDLDVVLAIRRDAEIEERRAEPHPDLGIIPGNHTRRIYFGKAHGAQAEATSNASIHLPEIVTQRSQDDWALVDQTRLFPELPPSLKERFGNEASLRFWVNGKEKVVLSGQFPVTMNLAEFLRYHLGLTGTKIGCGEELETISKEKVQLAAVVKHLKLVAHPQVRDVASWAGNVMIAKTHPDFPSDICLLLSTLGAKLTLMNASKKTEVVEIISFLSDSSLPRQDQAQIIHSVTIPFPGPDNFLDTFKVMRRHMNTHAEVNAGFLFQFNGGAEVASTRLVIGNIEHKPFVATETSKALLGKSLDSATISAASKVLEQELKAHLMEPTVPEPPFVVVDPQYRLSLATQLFVKAALRARMNRLGSQALSADERSAAEEPQRPASCGAQHFTVDHSTAPVGQPMEKFQGLDQACGTAQFVADTPLLPRTLFAVPILAERVALLQRIDAADCLEVTGVHSFISAADVKDVGASNDLKTTYPGKIFADAAEKTSHLGQFIGLVLAESFEAARSGARLVHVDYEESSEVTTTIDAAVQRGAVKERHGLLSVGAKVTGSQTLQGRLVSSGQKHLYLETQTTYAYHDCNGGLVFNTACQTLDWAQTQMAKTLNMPKSKITVQNQRLGGAYGGKAMLFAPVCGACGVAVLKSKRPVLLQMDRTLDFRAFGGRAPFDASWDLSHENGKIVSLKQEVLQNVGTDMLGFSQASSVNCYNIPHAQLHCKGVITNLPVNTWMRAPGDFEGAFIMEAIMEQVARAVGRDPVEVQELNLAEGMQKAWQRLKAKVAYEETRKAVKDFNSQSRYRKKGLYCMGSRYQLEPNTFMEKCFLR